MFLRSRHGLGPRVVEAMGLRMRALSWRRPIQHLTALLSSSDVKLYNLFLN